jgi:hypothetical protein
MFESGLNFLRDDLGAAFNLGLVAIRFGVRRTGGVFCARLGTRRTEEAGGLGSIQAPLEDRVCFILFIERKAVYRFLPRCRGEKSAAPWGRGLGLAPVPALVDPHPVQRLPERLRQVSLVEQDQAVGADEAGMDGFHRVADAIAAEQQARSDLVHGRAKDRRLRRRARPVALPWDAAAQPTRYQRRSIT